jgi:hypothetical protein
MVVRELFQNMAWVLMGRVDWLALTSGGRPIQGVLEGRAAFKEGTQGVSQATEGGFQQPVTVTVADDQCGAGRHASHGQRLALGGGHRGPDLLAVPQRQP